MYKSHNTFILIEPESLTEQFDNGMGVDTTVGSRMQIVTGIVKELPTEVSDKLNLGDKVWYPLYGASIISLRNGNFHMVDYEDIRLSQGDYKIDD